VRRLDDTLYYQCFFCGKGIAEDDPERRELIFARPGDKDLASAAWYACHPECASKAAHPMAIYMDPPSKAEQAHEALEGRSPSGDRAGKRELRPDGESEGTSMRTRSP
jgi:hypothetical protein